MTVKYSKFEMPKWINKDEENETSTFVRFIAEPFERGYAHTLGNLLRRIMLSSLESPAILSVLIEGVFHEYMAVEGIIEDMTTVILNFKGALLRRLPMDDSRSEQKIISKQLEITEADLEQGNGNYVVCFKDVFGESNFEMVNPDHKLFTVTKPMSKRIDIKVGYGRGYVTAERVELENKLVDEIVIDACHTPIRIVNYFVENTRVGQDTDFDRLILEVTTDGRITPDEALTFAAQIANEHLKVFENLKTHQLEFQKEKVETNKEKEDLFHKLMLKIDEIELSVRSTNCLASANIRTIGELVLMPESEMLRFRNFGKKSLTEIKEKLTEMGLCLGMDLSKYGINRDNIHEKLKNYLEEMAGAES